MAQQFTEAVDALRMALRDREWHFEENEEETSYAFMLDVTGNDLPMEARLMIDYKRKMATGLSFLPITVDDEHKLDVAVGVNMINYSLSVGSFDFNVFDGKILYRINTFVKEGSGDVDHMNKLIDLLFHITDEYNDLLMLLSKGLITLEQFSEKLDN